MTAFILWLIFCATIVITVELDRIATALEKDDDEDQT